MGSYLDAKERRARAAWNTAEAMVKRNICPMCGGSLDTGWECNDCGHDARSAVDTLAPQAEAGEPG